MGRTEMPSSRYLVCFEELSTTYFAIFAFINFRGQGTLGCAVETIQDKAKADRPLVSRRTHALLTNGETKLGKFRREPRAKSQAGGSNSSTTSSNARLIITIEGIAHSVALDK